MRVIRELRDVLDTRQKKRVALLCAMIFFSALLETLGVSIIIPLISAVVSPETILGNDKVQRLFSSMGLTLTRDGFVRILLIATMAVFVLKNAYLLLLSYVQARFVSKAQSDTSVRLLSEYLHRPYEYYLNADVNVMMQSIHSDIPHVFELLQESMLLVTEIAVCVCLCVLLLIVDFRMTVCIAALLVVMVLVILFLLKPTLGRLGERRVRQQATTMKWMQQSIFGIKDVKVSARENYFVGMFAEAYRQQANVMGRYTVLNGLPRLVIEAVCMVGIVAYMFLCVVRGEDLTAMLPQLTAFGLAAVRLMPSINRISSHLSAIAYFEPSLHLICSNLHISQLKDAEMEMRHHERCSPRREILLQDISYHYPNTDKEIFHHAQLRVPVGASVGVIGMSGAGKTTIVDILLGLLLPQAGQMLVDGEVMRGDDPTWLADIGYIAQNIYMLDATIRENVAFGVPEEEIDDARIWEVLHEAQLEDFVREQPEGLRSQIGDRGIRISGGQRQRIGIARALYHDPEVLVFDEATSALDNETEAAIMDAINALKGRKTMVIIAHRLKTIENCDILYRVEEGQIRSQIPLASA